MKGHMKSWLLLVTGMVAAVLGSVSLAWACTAQAVIRTVDPISGTPGTAVTVTGERFLTGPVEIRWDSQTGPLIGMVDARPGWVEGTEGASFVTTVVIPDATPGEDHLLLAVPAGSGLIGARTPFEVTAPTADPRDPKPPPPPGPTNPDLVDPDPVAPGPAAPPPSVPGPDQPAPSEPAVPATPAPAPATGPQAGTATPVEPSPQVRAPAPPARQPARPAPAPAAAPSVALPPAASTTSATDDRPSTDPAPARQVSGDLWSGFASGPDASPAPSLVDVPSDRSTSGLALGIALLVAGLVALVAAGGATVMTRRRARATSAA